MYSLRMHLHGCGGAGGCEGGVEGGADGCADGGGEGGTEGGRDGSADGGMLGSGDGGVEGGAEGGVEGGFGGEGVGRGDWPCQGNSALPAQICAKRMASPSVKPLRPLKSPSSSSLPCTYIPLGMGQASSSLLLVSSSRASLASRVCAASLQGRHSIALSLRSP